MITVAPTGAETAKADAPSLPVTLAEPAGGHLRVGMEDTLTFARGRPVTGNDELVARAADLARLAQRPPMTTDEARTLLRVKDRTSVTAGESR